MTDPTLPTISDPVRIRALTHPLRLELLDVLGDGPATATECAAATGESVASCSFHLRTLAKYGFIEPAERRGREKPWKLASPGTDVRPDDADPESVHAVGAMAQVYLEHGAEALRAWLSRLPSEPPEWVHATTLTGSSFWATSDELADLSKALQTMADRFRTRNHDPEQRPPGARPVRLFAAAHVDVDKERRSGPARE